MSSSENEHSDPAGIVTKTAPGSVSETVEHLGQLLAAKGLKLFAEIDHSGEASASGLTLRETRVVIFGSPLAGTPAMAAAPLLALDLPLKVLVWDDAGETRVSYLAPAALAARYSLEPQLAGPLSGIDGLTDAVAAG